MEMNFDNILSALLEEVDKNPTKDIDSLIAEKCNKFDLSEEGKNTLKETFEYLSAFAEKADSLEQAKEEGLTRKRWIMDQVDQITEGSDEQEKVAIVTAISESNAENLKEMLTDNEE